MSHKFLFVVALLAATAAISYAGILENVRITVNTQKNGKNHHLLIGDRLYADILLHRQVVHKNSKFLRTVSTDFKYATPRGQRITMVKAWNQNTKGTGASAFLANGGSERNNVQLHFESQKGHGIDYVIEVYGLK